MALTPTDPSQRREEPREGFALAAPAAAPAAAVVVVPPSTSLEPLETTSQISQEDIELQGILADYAIHVLPTMTPPEPERDPFDPTTALHHLHDGGSAAFIHSGWQPIRERIGAALARTHQPYNRLDSFCRCGGGATVMLEEATGKVALQAKHCHDRFCQVCAGAKARDYAARTAEVFKDQRPLFITLTLADTRDGLAASLRRLQEGFQDLRRTVLWKHAVRGGIAFIEVKWSTKAQRWHPHLHVLADSRYIDQGKLSTAWHAVTGDSFIVRRASRQHALRSRELCREVCI